MIHSNHASPLPASPPALSYSKSSKSSSLHSSLQSEDYTTTSSYMGNFEEIGLDDEDVVGTYIKDYSVKVSTNYNLHSYKSKPRTFLRLHSSSAINLNDNRELVAGKRNPSCLKPRSPAASVMNGLHLEVIPRSGKRLMNSFKSPPNKNLQRNHSLGPTLPNSKTSNLSSHRQNRTSLKMNREKKTTDELEKEFDEDDGEDVPDNCFLENVPISPRPLSQQSRNYSISSSTSPERPSKGKTKPLGNGTSAQPAEQGELRSARSTSGQTTNIGKASRKSSNQIKTRAMSWSAAMSDLSQEVRELTAALEDLENKHGKSQSMCQPKSEKARVKSALAELPPLRRTDIMIDPLPISREKEAVLSRTRPSWLPPKNPAEEKRHLKEYQKMMASSLEADRRKESGKQEKTSSEDESPKHHTQAWKDHVLVIWNTSIYQK